jgi:hypothetical protein
MRVERAPLDADVGNGIRIGETSVHRNLCGKQFRSDQSCAECVKRKRAGSRRTGHLSALRTLSKFFRVHQQELRRLGDVHGSHGDARSLKLNRPQAGTSAALRRSGA